MTIGMVKYGPAIVISLSDGSATESYEKGSIFQNPRLLNCRRPANRS